ncbi:MAG TPA: NAD(P)/FAD-dependent oxidoreductase [Chthoniobacterales bacterium]|jgi:geranylgeranyl reductase family protein
MFDVGIVGGGPAGSSCAAFCARAGLRTLLLEREIFPREKVCGDCLNPACWPILQRLELAQRVRALPHGVLDQVDFVGINGRRLTVQLPGGDEAEIAIKRSLFDQLLLTRAREAGAIVYEGTTVTEFSQPTAAKKNWTIGAGEKTFDSHLLVAADGRNSTVARLCNLLPRSAKERIALQTHLRVPPDFGNRVVLQFLPDGYCGQAPVGQSELNLCLVSRADKIRALRKWAEAHFEISTDRAWRTITPLARAPISPGHRSLFLIGDAARVVEPFTGEGIYYALASGELAAEAIISQRQGRAAEEGALDYSRGHARLYRGRLWINRLARAAVLSPRVASTLLELARFQPGLLRLLTRQIVREI